MLIDKETIETKAISIRVKEEFLSGGAKRFDTLKPETVIFLECLNGYSRSIQDIEADLEENDNLMLKANNYMIENGLVPEYNATFKLEEAGINHSIYKTYQDLANYGNALYIELAINQFSYYLEKLHDLGYNKFNDYLKENVKLNTVIDKDK